MLILSFRRRRNLIKFQPIIIEYGHSNNIITFFSILHVRRRMIQYQKDLSQLKSNYV